MDSHQRGRDSSRRTHTDLKPLETKADVQRFLNGIRREFLLSVNVEESGLEDALVQNGVLKCDSDVESLRCKYSVRKDKARRLWIILYTIDHTIFIEAALPVLCENYYHIIPPEFWKEPSDCTSMTSQLSGEAAENASEVSCVRCAAKPRIREKTMNDLLYQCQLITFDDYRKQTEEPLVRNWDSIFNILENINSDKIESFSRNFKKLLKSYSLTVPDNLEDLIKRGLPCTCSRQQEVSNSNDWQEIQKTWCYYSNHEYRRGSDVSTELSWYPGSEKDSDSCCSSRTSTLNESTLTSNTLCYLPPEPNEEAADDEHRDYFLGRAQARQETENKTRKRNDKGALSRKKHSVSSIINETKRFLRTQQNVDLGSHVSDVDKVGADRAESKQRAGGNFALHPDVLYKTFRLRSTRKKKRPALEEVVQRMKAPSTQQVFHDRTQNQTLGANEELDYVLPVYDCESHIQNFDIIEELTDSLTDSEAEDPTVTKELKDSFTEGETKKVAEKLIDSLSESDTENFGATKQFIDSLSESDTENFGATKESAYFQIKRGTESLDAVGDFLARSDTENQAFDGGLEDSVTASETDNDNVKDQLACPLSDFQCETQAKAPVTALDVSTEKYGAKETISSLSEDTAEDTAILTELCDLVASSFSLHGDLTDHLQKAQMWAVDEGHTLTMTVTSCLEMEAHLQDTFARLEKIKQERPASSSQQDSAVLMVYESVLKSCLGLVLGLKMCLLCDSTLELMRKLDLTSNRDAQVKLIEMRSSAKLRLRSCLEDILNKIKTVAEQQISHPGTEELSHLQEILSSILPHLN